MAKGKVLSTIIDIAGEISPTLGKTLGEVSEKLKGVNTNAIAAGAAIGAIGAATAVGVVKATKYITTLGDEYNRAVNDMAAKTGAAGEELDAMAESMKNIYASNLGEDMADVAASMSTVEQVTGTAGEALEKLTSGALMLRDTFDYDVNESTRAANALMENFGVSGEEAMNMIAAGAKNGLDFSGEMLDTISEYSSQFAKVGLDANDMFNILQSGADGTAWNLDKVGDTIKEFAIRSIDGSDSTKEAFEAIGLSSAAMSTAMATGGYAAEQAFQKTLNRLLAMKDPIARDAAGVALFGTQWEDMGVEAMKSLADVQDGAYATGEELAAINDIKYKDLGSAMQSIKRQAEVTILPLASTVANMLTDMGPLISDLFNQIGPLITDVVNKSMPFVTEFLGGIMEFIPIIAPMITQLAASILPLLSTFISQLLPPLLDLIQQILPPVIQIAQQVLPALTGILLSVLPILTQIISAVLPVILDLINALLPAFMPIIDILLEFLQGVILPLMEPIGELIQSLLPALEPLLKVVSEALGGVFDCLGPIFDVLGGIIGFIGKVVGWVAQGLTWVVDLIFGGTDEVEDAAEVNGYAAGGFTDGISIAGEAGTEAVISFDPAYRSDNLAYWAQAGRMLGATPEDAGFALSGTASGTTVIDMGGVNFAPNIQISGKADQESVIQAIEAEYPEFLDMLERWLYERGLLVYG